jgi:Do/DeqQ family serine protease
MAAEAQTRQPRNDLELKATYAPIVAETAPAVVNIYTSRTVRTRSVFDDPFFSQFFGTRPGGRERRQNSLGSGVIVDPNGLIVTNNHVVEGMDEIRVVLNDRREFEADLLLTDPQTDLAILKIETEDPLPSVRFADSDQAEVGDIVLAIGNPFGVGQTVTSGIVSALSRTNVSVSDYQFFIQTDAAINPGNSGGALVDVDGRLLGINTAIYSRSGGSNGIGFAIPGNLVQRVVASAAGGSNTVQRPWLGVLGTDIDSRIATALGLDRPRGALISRLYPGGPADRAGLREGDVILSIAGQNILDGEGLRYRPATREEGETVEIRYLRDGRERRTRSRLELPPEIPAAQETTVASGPFAGLTLANLSPALNDELGRNPFDQGIVVLSGTVVEIPISRRRSRRLGIPEGSVIAGVNGETFEGAAALARRLERGGIGTLTLRDRRGREATYRLAG